MKVGEFYLEVESFGEDGFLHDLVLHSMSCLVVSKSTLE